MKLFRTLSALALILSLCLSAAAAEAGKVTVSGSAEVSAVTDHAIIHLGVRTRADTPSEAQADNNLRTDAVMKALTDTCGIAKEKIATSEFSIYTLSEWVEETGKERQYYQVMHEISVTVDQIDRTGAVIDACVTAGANIVNYVTFASSNMQEAYDQALQAAVADAQRKAELIAAAAGMKLGAIETITTLGGGSDVYNNTFSLARGEEAPEAADTKLAPGMQRTSATVTITWTLEENE